MTPQSFIQTVLPAARGAEASWKVPVSVCVAQAALETGWGKSVVGNNYFGIKATPSNGGVSVSSPTMEFVEGKWVSTVASFCRYSSLNQSAFEYGKLLASNPIYGQCFEATTASGFCRALQAAGYATDPSYADKLVDIISQYDLTQYDK